MGISGDRYVGEYEGHSIELVRDNVVKSVRLVVDGREVALQSVALPTTYDLHGEFEHAGGKHTVFAHSEFKKLLGLIPYDHDVAVEVDGKPIGLTKTK
jgi:hypothetical protein